MHFATQADITLTPLIYLDCSDCWLKKATNRSFIYPDATLNPLCGRSVFGLNHGFFEAGPDTFATLDAKRVIDLGISVGVLRYGSDRAYFDEGAHVIVGAKVLVNFYHCWFIVL